MSLPPKRGLVAPKIPGLVQSPVDRPAPQFPQLAQCGLCKKVCDSRGMTADLFRGWLCVGCTRSAPDPAH